MDILCPIDRKDDAIQKVSGVVSAGRSEGLQYGRDTTDLARLLSLPSEPDTRAFTAGNWLGFMTLALVGFITMLFGVLSTESADGTALSCLICGGLMVGALPLAFLVNSKNRLMDQITADAWRSELHRWSHLYYCSRHDLVFDPGTGRTATPAEMQTLIC